MEALTLLGTSPTETVVKEDVQKKIMEEEERGRNYLSSLSEVGGKTT